jgi:tetratricopeptide (TPR) repeat protein
MLLPCRPLVPGTLGLLAVLLLPARADAQSELVLKDHAVLQGKVVSCTAESVTFDHVVGGRSVGTLTYPVAQIEPVSFYYLRRPALGNDAAATIALGKYCLQHGLNARARDLFETAERLDPSHAAQIGTLKAHTREASAAELLDEARTDQASGDPYHALDTLEECIRYFGDTPSGEKAKDLVKSFDAAYRARYTVTQAQDTASEDTSELGQASQIVAGADHLVTEALSEKETSQSLQLYQQAVAEYGRAVEELDRIAHEHPGDAGATGGIASAKRKAVDGAVRAHLNAAGIYMTRTDYQQALVEANQALAVDPDSNAAKALRVRIATVSGLSSW